MRIRKIFYGWPVLLVLMYVFVAELAAPYFGAGIISTSMATEMHLDRSALGLGFAMFALFSGLPAPFVAWTMARRGARWTMTVGALIMAAGAAAAATLVYNKTTYIVIFGGVIGVGIAFGSTVPAQATVAQWFSRKRALALALLWISVGAGGTIIAPVLGKVVTAIGWRAGWWVISAMGLLAALLVGVFVRNHPEDKNQTVDGTTSIVYQHSKATAAKTHRSSEEWTIRLATSTSAFWIVTACAIAYSLPVVVMFAHLTAHLRDLGLSTGAAATGLGLVGLSQIGGKLAFGVLGDRIEPRFLWGWAMLIMALSLCLAAGADTPTTVYAFAVLLGFGQGASLVAYPTTLGNYFGAASFANVAGFQSAIVNLIISCGPYLAGLFYDHTGSYVPLFITMAAILVAGSAAITISSPPS